MKYLSQQFYCLQCNLFSYKNTKGPVWRKRPICLFRCSKKLQLPTPESQNRLYVISCGDNQNDQIKPENE